MSTAATTMGRTLQYVTDLQPADVLFGRGSGPNDHEGNIRFRTYVAARKAEYMSTNHRMTKTKIAREIVSLVFDDHGRFLKKLEPKEAVEAGLLSPEEASNANSVVFYELVDEDTIMEKAKQALRQNAAKVRAGHSPLRNSGSSLSPVPGSRRSGSAYSTDSHGSHSTTTVPRGNHHHLDDDNDMSPIRQPETIGYHHHHQQQQQQQFVLQPQVHRSGSSSSGNHNLCLDDLEPIPLPSSVTAMGRASSSSMMPPPSNNNNNNHHMNHHNQHNNTADQWNHEDGDDMPISLSSLPTRLNNLHPPNLHNSSNNNNKSNNSENQRYKQFQQQHHGSNHLPDQIGSQQQQQQQQQQQRERQDSDDSDDMLAYVQQHLMPQRKPNVNAASSSNANHHENNHNNNNHDDDDVIITNRRGSLTMADLVREHNKMKTGGGDASVDVLLDSFNAMSTCTGVSALTQKERDEQRRMMGSTETMGTIEQLGSVADMSMGTMESSIFSIFGGKGNDSMMESGFINTSAFALGNNNNDFDDDINGLINQVRREVDDELLLNQVRREVDDERRQQQRQQQQQQQQQQQNNNNNNYGGYPNDPGDF